MNGKFQIFKSAANKRWYWTLIAENGEPILKTTESDGFENTEQTIAATKEVRLAVKQHFSGHKTIERFLGTDKQHYFRISGETGKLGVSEGYTTDGGRAQGIDSVLFNAPDADIEVLAEPK